MAHQEEPMDVDSSMCDFDNKENAFQHGNVLPKTPCTEKGYEELDVSELNVKLRYSTTPASSPMSKSFTANVDNSVSNNGTNSENAIMTQSLHSTLTGNENRIPKTLPLMVVADPTCDGTRSILRPIDSIVTHDNIQVTISTPNNSEDLMSYPSSSSSSVHTPEATTPTKEIAKDAGSPIMGVFKSVLNMFRPSQSPIPPEDENSLKPDVLSPPTVCSPSIGDNTEAVLLSTPLTTRKTVDMLTKRTSPVKENVVFNEELQNELQWSDESTIIFDDEKVPLHKLFFQNAKPTTTPKPKPDDIAAKPENMMDNTVEYMDISYNDSVKEKTMNITQDKFDKSDTNAESDSEFVDCETTFNKNESLFSAETSLEYVDLNLDSTKDIIDKLTVLSDDTVNVSTNTLEVSTKSNNLSNVSVETAIAETNNSTLEVIKNQTVTEIDKDPEADKEEKLMVRIGVLTEETVSDEAKQILEDVAVKAGHVSCSLVDTKSYSPIISHPDKHADEAKQILEDVAVKSLHVSRSLVDTKSDSPIISHPDKHADQAKQILEDIAVKALHVSCSLVDTKSDSPIISDPNKHVKTYVTHNHIVENNSETVPRLEATSHIVPTVDNDCNVVNSITQIPLIADPRILLFNISSEVSVDDIIVNNSNVESSAADMPLPDDDDLESLPPISNIVVNEVSTVNEGKGREKDVHLPIEESKLAESKHSIEATGDNEFDNHRAAPQYFVKIKETNSKETETNDLTNALQVVTQIGVAPIIQNLVSTEKEIIPENVKNESVLNYQIDPLITPKHTEVSTIEEIAYSSDGKEANSIASALESVENEPVSNYKIFPLVATTESECTTKEIMVNKKFEYVETVKVDIILNPEKIVAIENTSILEAESKPLIIDIPQSPKPENYVAPVSDLVIKGSVQAAPDFIISQRPNELPKHNVKEYVIKTIPANLIAKLNNSLGSKETEEKTSDVAVTDLPVTTKEVISQSSVELPLHTENILVEMKELHNENEVIVQSNLDFKPVMDISTHNSITPTNSVTDTDKTIIESVADQEKLTEQKSFQFDISSAHLEEEKKADDTIEIITAQNDAINKSIEVVAQDILTNIIDCGVTTADLSFSLTNNTYVEATKITEVPENLQMNAEKKFISTHNSITPTNSVTDTDKTIIESVADQEKLTEQKSFQFDISSAHLEEEKKADDTIEIITAQNDAINKSIEVVAQDILTNIIDCGVTTADLSFSLTNNTYVEATKITEVPENLQINAEKKFIVRETSASRDKNIVIYEEMVTSESNSPFVSLTAEKEGQATQIATEKEKLEDVPMEKLKEEETLFTEEQQKQVMVEDTEENMQPTRNIDDTENASISKSRILTTPPSSPAIVSKGYNFNFDAQVSLGDTKADLSFSLTDNTFVEATKITEVPENIQMNTEKEFLVRETSASRNKNVVIDEETVTSESNSPFVSLTAEKEGQATQIATEKEKLEDVPMEKLKEEETPFTEEQPKQVMVEDTEENMQPNNNIDDTENASISKSRILTTPPSSPAIVSKGYNFNFDDIEDPFATKTKVRQSPPTGASPNQTFSHLDDTLPVIESPKIDIPRRPQPQKRKSIRANKNLVSTNPASPVVKNKKVVHTSDIKTGEHLEAELPKLNKDLPITKHMKNENVATNNELMKGVPGIDDPDFNPFVTNDKMRSSPLPSLDETVNNVHSSPTQNSLCENFLTLNISSERPLSPIAGDTKEDKTESLDDSNSENNVTCLSKTSTMQGVNSVNTEDEDTIEGPFLDEMDLNNDKMSNFDGDDVSMFELGDLPPENDVNAEGEVFIDAEAFEFLLNQNKTNFVADSGKESLFLKFDPLYTKRMSGAGISAAFTRKETPKKTPKSSPQRSTFGATPEHDATFITTVQQDETFLKTSPQSSTFVEVPSQDLTIDETMEQDLTFVATSVAGPPKLNRTDDIGGNNAIEECLVDLNVTIVAKPMMVVKPAVYPDATNRNLRERLCAMEYQINRLEKIGQDRLKNINELNENLTEKTQMNKTMAKVVEEYEKTIASLITATEQDKKQHAEERMQLIKQREEAASHMASLEVSFTGLKNMYEKCRQVIFGFKANEDALKKSVKDFEETVVKLQKNYDTLKQHATAKLNHANEELDKLKKSHEAEVLKLNTLIKRKEVDITSLEENLEQKIKTNEELAAICDTLLAKLG